MGDFAASYLACGKVLENLYSIHLRSTEDACDKFIQSLPRINSVTRGLKWFTHILKHTACLLYSTHEGIWIGIGFIELTWILTIAV